MANEAQSIAGERLRPTVYHGRQRRRSSPSVETLGDSNLLSDAPETLATLQTEPFLLQVLDDADTDVRIAGIALAGRLGPDEALETLRELQRDPKLKCWATAALVRALLQRQPDEALEVIPDEHAIAPELVEELLAAASRLSDEAVARLRSHELSPIRGIALRIDIAAGRLTEETDRVALADDEVAIRRRALDAMLENRWAVDEETFREITKAQLMPTFLAPRRRLLQAMTATNETLRALADWYTHGPKRRTRHWRATTGTQRATECGKT